MYRNRKCVKSLKMTSFWFVENSIAVLQLRTVQQYEEKKQEIPRMLYESKSTAEQPVIISIGHLRHFLFVYSAKADYNTLTTKQIPQTMKAKQYSNQFYVHLMND